MATCGATSKTSAVTDSRPLRPSTFPCIFTLKSFTFMNLKLNPFATCSSFDMIVEAEHFDVKIDPAFRLFSNKLERSNPDDIEEMNSNALRKGGDDFDFTTRSSSSVFSGDGSSIENAMGRVNPFLNQGSCIISGIVIRLLGSATRSLEINRLAS
uniref:Uncharacterized protein n=1 Tax=Nelumbo nucifera TaxID=4432 RepID=A0A822ZK37_NELNU|nr:TPA_asm: hypothetical protein HUJ06_003467 [Nelumbo nucifera]